MEKAILLAIAASLCTATASVCQRLGARSNETTGFDVWLVFRLARRPVWLLGVASMILGFAFQLSALHYGELALVQPIYVLITVGAATMLLASHALAAGPLAASQPGFTILDPLAASLLGVFLFGEHIRTGVFDLAGEALALAVVVAGATALSHSCLILGADGDPSCLPAGYQAQGHREQLRKLTLEYQPADAPGPGEAASS